MRIVQMLAMGLALSALWLAGGCTEQATTGTVTGYTPAGPGVLAEGQAVPSFQFQNADGQGQSLRDIRQPVMLIGFVSGAGERCQRLEPTLVDLASRYNDRPVRVVQVAVPQGPCPHGQCCTQVCRMPRLPLIALCDGAGEAWQSFGEPEMGTVFLVNQQGLVARRGQIGNLDALVDEADELSRAAELQYRPTQ